MIKFKFAVSGLRSLQEKVQNFAVTGGYNYQLKKFPESFYGKLKRERLHDAVILECIRLGYVGLWKSTWDVTLVQKRTQTGTQLLKAFVCLLQLLMVTRVNRVHWNFLSLAPSSKRGITPTLTLLIGISVCYFSSTVTK